MVLISKQTITKGFVTCYMHVLLTPPNALVFVRAVSRFALKKFNHEITQKYAKEIMDIQAADLLMGLCIQKSRSKQMRPLRSGGCLDDVLYLVGRGKLFDLGNEFGSFFI